MEKINWKTERRSTKELIPAEYNPRKISEKDLAALTVSLEKFNVADPIIINADNKIIGGHQRIRALIAAGVEEVDVRIPDRQLTIEEERELNLRLNKNTGEWDFAALAEFDEDMLRQVGFDSKELDKIFQLAKPEDDAAPEQRENTSVKYGDIYQLGAHRIMCGDSTKAEDVNLLMAGKLADLVFTDPPYNVNYSGRGKDTSNKIENDNMDQEAFRAFLIAAFKCYELATKPEAALYCCYASRTHREFEDALNEAGFIVKNQIIWVKLVASMGWGDYRWKHEPMFYANKKGSKIEFYGDRKQYTAWDEEKSDEELLKMIKSMITKDENGGSTVWRFNRESNYVHPTQKPVALIERAIINSSKREDIVLDLFGGSGSTLIAAEKLNRVFFGMELDPKYVDVIVRRWEEFTGNKAEKINDGAETNGR